ncbi:MAG: molybdenum cofactor biosynthesis protein MoaE [Candidatus Rariloculaceae bacterium]
MTFALTDQRLDPQALRDNLLHDSAGAFVAFEGWVRDHNDGQPVTALEYEAHETVATKEGERIVAEAIERFDILAAFGRHRVGRLEIGDCAVWVGVSAAHRGVAFDACRYIIDELKQRVPIWKKEHYVAGPSGWINSQTRTESAELDPES